MREILFRGKSKNLGNWVEGSYAILDPVDKPEYIRKPCHVIIPGMASFHLWNSYLHTFHQVVPETVGQFIGQLDKNGNKIFEGDILERRRRFEAPERIVIDFECSSFSYHIVGNAPGYDCIDDCDYGINVSDYTIIGNIHDNPELLSDDKK